MHSAPEKAATDTVAAIIIAWNEADALRLILPELPAALIDELIVVDGGSTDGTVEVAASLGARVVQQPGRGYGDACWAGARAATADILVFLDGDYADDPAEFKQVLEPVLVGRADLTVGSRNGPGTEADALPAHQRFGNGLACLLIRLLYRVRMEDIGSFRAIRRETLLALGMCEMTYGWPVEMVVKASREGLRIEGVPVRYRRRIGHSKVGGTLKGSMKAGWLMMAVIVRYAFKRPHRLSSRSSKG